MDELGQRGVIVWLVGEAIVFIISLFVDHQDGQKGEKEKSTDRKHSNSIEVWFESFLQLSIMWSVVCWGFWLVVAFFGDCANEGDPWEHP